MTWFAGASVLVAWRRALAAWLVGGSRYRKRVILVAVDLALLNFVLWLALSLRHGTLYLAGSWPLLLVLGSAPVISIAVFAYAGLYRVVTRYFSGATIALIFSSAALSGLIWALVVLLSGLAGVPRSVVAIYPLICGLAGWGSRAIAQLLLRGVGETRFDPAPQMHAKELKRALIYGAGATGVHLLEVLRSSADYSVAGFVDMNPSLWRQRVGGLKVHRPELLPKLVREHAVGEVFLAMPKALRRERKTALQQLEQLPIAVRVMPAIDDLAAGRVTVTDLREVEVDDLLGRDSVPPNADLLARSIKDKSVLVTGAGGSIGSELVRQILRQSPRRMVLFERGEEQLYEIGLKVDELSKTLSDKGVRRPQIVSVLGSVCDDGLVRATLKSNGIETVYHAAAFKHVPILEHNPIACVQNNTFGTAILADAAEQCAVERVVLVSTDKAVRPSSVMGASKRLAELAFQARAAEAGGGTVFTMVRFGNVLDSSGSVVRRFRRQIQARGPVTVTHREAVRYFMSIPEAAALVIQAGAMAEGGEVFLLDMGEPVSIDRLARSMIRLSGLEVCDEDNPYGDVTITYTGLRDGEKLYEELLLGGNATTTEHPCIRKCDEPFLTASQLAVVLERLRAAMAKDDTASVRNILVRAAGGVPQDYSAPREPEHSSRAVVGGARIAT